MALARELDRWAPDTVRLHLGSVIGDTYGVVTSADHMIGEGVDFLVDSRLFAG